MKTFGDFADYSEMWDAYLVEFCSPTLAGIKPANLFNIAYKNENELEEQIERMNLLCQRNGVKVKLMREKNQKALIYIYREAMLQEIMTKKCVWSLLKKCGYQNGPVLEILETLKKRMEQFDSFPHEIGIFLGYPYGDVIGFIKNTGRNCLYTGYWKVYENEQESRLLFKAFDACKRNYRQEFYNGMPLSQLVAAV